jgi:hypothetical protein
MISDMDKASRAFDSPERVIFSVGGFQFTGPRIADLIPPPIEITCDRCSERFTDGV